MAHQVLQAASKGFGTYKLTGGAGLGDTSLVALIATALGLSTPSAIPAAITGCNINIVTATAFFWENDGTAASADTMPLSAGDELVIPKNSRECLFDTHIFITGAYDLRVMLW